MSLGVRVPVKLPARVGSRVCPAPHRVSVLCLLVLLLLSGGAPRAGDTRPTVSPPTIQGVQGDMDARLRRVEQLLESKTLLQMLSTIEQLQTELGQLRGQMEVQGNTLETIKTRQRELFNDMDDRLLQLETGTGGAKGDAVARAAGLRTLDLPEPEQTVAPVVGEEQLIELAMPAPVAERTATPPVPIGRVEVLPVEVTLPPAWQEPATSEPVVGVVTETVPVLPMEAAPAPPAAKTSVAVVSEGLPNQALDTEPGEPAVVTDPMQIQAEYDRAFSLLREQHYARARDAFRSFVQRFPDSRHADNAQYWLGEAYYASKEYEEALIEYETLVVMYPQSTKFTHAMLKIAFSYQSMGNEAEAARRLNELMENHPNTTAARLAQARLETFNN